MLLLFEIVAGSLITLLYTYLVYIAGSTGIWDEFIDMVVAIIKGIKL